MEMEVHGRVQSAVLVPGTATFMIWPQMGAAIVAPYT